jgi:hypothetical protein
MENTINVQTIEKLEVLSGILLRSFLILFVFMLFSWLMSIIFSDFIYALYSKMYHIDKQNFDIFTLYTLLLVKILNIVFFVVPYLAIKLYLYSKS